MLHYFTLYHITLHYITLYNENNSAFIAQPLHCTIKSTVTTQLLAEFVIVTSQLNGVVELSLQTTTQYILFAPTPSLHSALSNEQWALLHSCTCICICVCLIPSHLIDTLYCTALCRVGRRSCYNDLGYCMLRSIKPYGHGTEVQLNTACTALNVTHLWLTDRLIMCHYSVIYSEVLTVSISISRSAAVIEPYLCCYCCHHHHLAVCVVCPPIWDLTIAVHYKLHMAWRQLELLLFKVMRIIAVIYCYHYSSLPTNFYSTNLTFKHPIIIILNIHNNHLK